MLFKKISDYSRLLRVTAFLRRFFHNAKNPFVKKLSFLTSDELHEAQLTILKMVQAEALSKELILLK